MRRHAQLHLFRRSNQASMFEPSFAGGRHKLSKVCGNLAEGVWPSATSGSCRPTATAAVLQCGHGSGASAQRFGIELDEAKNQAAVGKEAAIHTERSAVQVSGLDRLFNHLRPRVRWALGDIAFNQGHAWCKNPA